MTGRAGVAAGGALAVETAERADEGGKGRRIAGLQFDREPRRRFAFDDRLGGNLGGTGRARKVDDDPGFAGGKQAEAKPLHERNIGQLRRPGRPTDRVENSPPACRRQCDRARPRRRRSRRPFATGRTPVWPPSHPVRAARRPRRARPPPSRTRSKRRRHQREDGKSRQPSHSRHPASPRRRAVAL